MFASRGKAQVCLEKKERKDMPAKREIAHAEREDTWLPKRLREREDTFA